MSTVRRRLNDYIGYLPPQDASHVLRLVGFVEYTVALDHLDRFLSTATPSEIKIAEAIVEERPEFIVHSNISRKWEGSNSFLSESKKEATYAQHSLKCVTALARVEVGAALAGFTSVPAPFAVKGPTAYDSDEYEKIVLDGYRSMYWTIAADPNLNSFTQVAIPKELLLIELRRLGLAHLLGDLSLQLLKPKLTAVQLAEIKSWQQRLEQLDAVVSYCVIKSIGVQQAKGKPTEFYFPHCAVSRGDANKLLYDEPEESQKAAKELRKYSPIEFLKMQLEQRYWQVLRLVKCE